MYRADRRPTPGFGGGTVGCLICNHMRRPTCGRMDKAWATRKLQRYQREDTFCKHERLQGCLYGAGRGRSEKHPGAPDARDCSIVGAESAGNV